VARRLPPSALDVGADSSLPVDVVRV
jgi:hypothetical protein